jgi:ATP-binding cassette, subfamily F, member 3
LLSDVTLTLSCGRRYGLIGRNGAGKTTLMNTFARYEHSALRMLKVLLVDQHVEGDDDSAIQWCLRQDVERSMLMEEEQVLSRYLQFNPDSGDKVRLVDHIVLDAFAS